MLTAKLFDSTSVAYLRIADIGMIYPETCRCIGLDSQLCACNTARREAFEHHLNDLVVEHRSQYKFVVTGALSEKFLFLCPRIELSFELVQPYKCFFRKLQCRSFAPRGKANVMVWEFLFQRCLKRVEFHDGCIPFTRCDNRRNVTDKMICNQIAEARKVFAQRLR